jgi:hypothetical protein
MPKIRDRAKNKNLAISDILARTGKFLKVLIWGGAMELPS